MKRKRRRNRRKRNMKRNRRRRKNMKRNTRGGGGGTPLVPVLFQHGIRRNAEGVRKQHGRESGGWKPRGGAILEAMSDPFQHGPATH